MDNSFYKAFEKISDDFISGAIDAEECLRRDTKMLADHRAAEAHSAAHHITTSQAVATMQKYGGNGVQKLAACWLALDSEKRQRLEQAFEPEFKHYRTMYAEDVKAAA